MSSGRRRHRQLEWLPPSRGAGVVDDGQPSPRPAGRQRLDHCGATCSGVTKLMLWQPRAAARASPRPARGSGSTSSPDCECRGSGRRRTSGCRSRRRSFPAARAAQAVLLAEVWEPGADPGVASSGADPRFVLEPIDAAVALVDPAAAERADSLGGLVAGSRPGIEPDTLASALPPRRQACCPGRRAASRSGALAQRSPL